MWQHQVLLRPNWVIFKGEFIKSELYDMSLIVTLLGGTPPTLTPGSRRPKRGARWVSEASAVHLGKNSINQSCWAPPT